MPMREMSGIRRDPYKSHVRARCEFATSAIARPRDVVVYSGNDRSITAQTFNSVLRSRHFDRRVLHVACARTRCCHEVNEPRTRCKSRTLQNIATVAVGAVGQYNMTAITPTEIARDSLYASDNGRDESSQIQLDVSTQRRGGNERSLHLSFERLFVFYQRIGNFVLLFVQ